MTMTDEEKRSCIATIRTLLSAYRSYSNTMIQIDDDNVEKIIKLIQDGGERHERIKALEQQPCDDCISREALRQEIQEHYDFFVNAFGSFKNMTYIDKARVDEISNCIGMVVNAPSITPQRPKGKWTQKAGSRVLWCSVCEDCIPEEIPYAFDYCPNCGADMRGEEE